MKTIYKFPLRAGIGYEDIHLPVGSVPLTVQEQNGIPCLWVVVDAEDPTTQPYRVHVIGTGLLLPHHVARLQYLGTLQPTGTYAGEVHHFFGGF